MALSVFPALPARAQSPNAVSGSAITAAEQALAAADAMQAQTLATSEYQQAESTLQAANDLLDKRKSKQAEHLAVQARLYANLATAKARYIQTKESVEQKISDNQALRRELLLSRDGQPP